MRDVEWGAFVMLYITLVHTPTSLLCILMNLLPSPHPSLYFPSILITPYILFVPLQKHQPLLLHHP